MEVRGPAESPFNLNKITLFAIKLLLSVLSQKRKRDTTEEEE